MEKNPFMSYIETGQIDFTEGHLKLFNQSMVMFPTTTYLNLYKKCAALGPKGKKMIYDIGYEQIKAVFSEFDKAYDIANMNADSFINLFAPTVLICGWGQIEFSQVKFKKGERCIVCVKDNPFALLYKRTSGLQKACVDDFLLGLYSGGFSCITGLKVKGEETKCIARGDSHCEFTIDLF
ncbi:MAG: hypothetical protein HGA85_04340 [Nanoarchaeota archaeon]|nr:hypothetical protein [Nanoarchaeota archaeon]